MSEVLPTPEPVLSLSKSKKAKSKVEILKAYAAQFHAYLQAAGGPAAWEAHVRESLAEAPEFGECYLPEAEEAVFAEIGPAPQGWKNWNWAVHTLDDQPVMQVKRVVTVKEDDLSNSDLTAAPKTPKAPKVPKPKKEAIARDMRSVFNRLMAEVTPESLYRPWMAQHTLRLIETPEALKTWINRVQGDFSSWHLTPTGEKMPVVAVDTETFGTISTTGLDTRLVRGRPQIDIAGICLCADGLDSIYIPLNHEEGPNLDRKLVREMLQPLFDTSYLVYFNAKFDREVLRLTMGISFRDYPYFEDVQVDNYLLDPKADLDEEVSDYGGAGLKDLALRDLGIDQIELGELSKVKALYVNPQNNKKSYRNFYAPFSWLPPRIAYLYAAADSLTTWLLWKKKSEAASRMKFAFKLDHMLIDSLTWIERQRFLIDTARHAETVALHHRKMAQFRAKLEELSGVPGFNPGSTAQLADVLFNKLGFPKGKVSEKTQAASTDKTVLEDLKKAFPGHPFLIALSRYRSYASLHPSSLEYDKRDFSARMFFKQCTVAGGRLAAMGGGIKGGKGKDDGGFGLNPQAIKGVKGNKWAKGRAIIFPEGTADLFEPEWLEPIADDLLDASILKKTDDKITIEAPDVVNGVAHYMGRWWSFRPEPVLTAAPSATAREAYGFGETLTLQIETQTQSVDVNEVVNLRGLFIAPPGYTLFVTDYCLVPGTRLLTPDLRWVDVADVRVGDALIGFDEHLPQTKYSRRLMQKSTVEEVQRFELPCVELRFASGRVVTCSEDHAWLKRVRKFGSPYARGQYDFRKSVSLAPGDEIAVMCDPWDTPEDTREIGYLQGVYDGEGWVAKETIGFAQKEGPVLDATQALLEKHGFSVVREAHASDVLRLRFVGGRNQTLRFLGTVRPHRLIRNVWNQMINGKACHSRYTQPDTVVSVTPVGVREVVAVRTDTHTFIAEGLLSHNCNIEMRVAANVSREQLFIDEFLTGSGDFHTLTAKSVFPEFSTTKDKVVRKMLRDLAKIINFALLYGGTEHTIYENMKKQDPTITKEKAKAMVDKYWDSVPMFAMWAHSMRKAARETLICKTPDGRVIDFRSALAAEGLTEPAKESYKATRHYWDVRNRAKALEAAGRKEEAKTVFAQAQAIWDDPDSGVANAAGYKKMVGKFERVSVNAPLQGLAGDLMRRALVLIHRWAERAGVEGALLVHASVHDEIDFCIKNEYVPYVLPRITRIMKLRDLHAACKWPVPIECDCEYGTSWDVKFHLTGDDGHTASGYTNVPGLETYIPAILDPEVETSLFAAMDGGPDTRNEAIAYLKEALCARVHDVLDRIQPKPDPDPKRTPPTPDPTEARRLLVAALQLHEYWAIDQNEDPATDEPLASYMERFGLEPFPGLGEHVLSTVKVEELPPLEATAEPAPDVATDETEEVENDVAAEVVHEALPVATPAPVDVTPEPLTVTPPPPAPPEKKKVPLRHEGRLVLRDLTEDELKDFKRAIGVGGYTLKVIFKGETFDVHKCGGTPVPEHFLVMVDADE